MNRIEKKFQELKAANKTAFIGFVTAGDPTIDTCYDCILEMAKNGCDLIELGVPFSDPIAEGPVIQEASERALLNGTTTDDVMELVTRLRKKTQLPLVYLLYFNQIFTYGITAFLKACQACGIDGLIIPDLPYEHTKELLPEAKQYGIQLISLVTPVSEKRKKMIAENSEGFLYCVTSLGVTGERSSFQMDLKAFLEELNHYTTTPKALGFGISNADQIKELKAYGDGVIVGSAIVSQVKKLGKNELTLAQFGAFIKQLADAAHE